MIKDIPGHHGFKISTDGEVFTSWMRNGAAGALMDESKARKMKLFYRSGYPCVAVKRTGDNKYRNEFVHRLVLLTFVGPCPRRREACHNDGVRTNCKLENLRWDTKKSNAKDRIKHGRNYGPRGELSHSAKLNRFQVQRIRLIREITGISAKKIAPLFGVSIPNIKAILQRRSWKHILTKDTK